MISELAYLLGGFLIILIPGFLFSITLYPQPRSLDFWERTGVSLGLGVLILLYEVSMLARLKSLTLQPFLLSVVVVSVFLSVGVFLRRGIRAMKEYFGVLWLGFSKIGKRIGRTERVKKPLAVETKPEQGVQCHACEGLNPPDVFYCIHCGHRLKEAPSTPPSGGEAHVQVQTGDSG